MKIPDALVYHNCTTHHSIVIGVTFSHIMIMPQAKFLVRVHPLVASNTIRVQNQILIYDNYDKIFLSTCDGVVTELHILPDTKFHCL